MLLAPLLDYLAVAKHGSLVFAFSKIFVIFPMLSAAFSLIFAMPMLFMRSKRNIAAKGIVIAICIIASTIAGLRMGNYLRMNAFEQLAERSMVLINSIRSYEAKYGKAPHSLNELVPEFMQSVPGTEIAAYPNYRYIAGEEAKAYEENPWVLIVDSPSGGINFDQFMYLPRQNYPEYGYGGILQPVADWVYVHE